jgi:hypothetical protein
VLKARRQSSDHMAEEEREGLPRLPAHAPLELRHRLGAEFAAYEAGDARAIPIKDDDPKQYGASRTSGDGGAPAPLLVIPNRTPQWPEWLR